MFWMALVWPGLERNGEDDRSPDFLPNDLVTWALARRFWVVAPVPLQCNGYTVIVGRCKRKGVSVRKFLSIFLVVWYLTWSTSFCIKWPDIAVPYILSLPAVSQLPLYASLQESGSATAMRVTRTLHVKKNWMLNAFKIKIMVQSNCFSTYKFTLVSIGPIYKTLTPSGR